MKKHKKPDPFYLTPEWKKLRFKKIYLNPYCELCIQRADTNDPRDFLTSKERERLRFIEAQEVDHQIEIKDDPTLALVITNLVSLCSHCHRLKTEHQKRLRKADELGLYTEQEEREKYIVKKRTSHTPQFA